MILILTAPSILWPSARIKFLEYRIIAKYLHVPVYGCSYDCIKCISFTGLGLLEMFGLCDSRPSTLSSKQQCLRISGTFQSHLHLDISGMFASYKN